jgi:hypothetical protein
MKSLKNQAHLFGKLSIKLVFIYDEICAAKKERIL